MIHPHLYLPFCMLTVVLAARNVTVDYTSTNLTYSAGWFSNPSFSSCGNVSAVINASATLQFTGSAIYVVGQMDSFGGLIQVELDSNLTTFDRFSSAKICDQIMYQRTDLSTDPHSITVSLIGSTPAGSSHFIVLQYFEYTIPDPTSSTSPSTNATSPTATTAAGPATSPSTSTTNSTTNKPNHTAAIAGGVVGAIIVISGIGIGWYKHKKNAPTGMR